MSISQANGADLLNLYSQSVGQGAVASAVTASVNVLKTAIAQAKLCASEIIAGNSDSGNQINLYA